MGPAEFVIPTGLFRISEDRSMSALIRTSMRSRDKVLAAVEAVSRLGPPVFSTCAGFRQDTEGFHLTWLAPRGEAKCLPDLAALWRLRPAAHIPEALAVAWHIYRASSEMDYLRPLRFLFSPPQVYLGTGESGLREWRVAPLPIEGAGVSDFVAASESSTVWLPGDELLGAGLADRGYLVAAVLYYCLISDLYPAGLPRGERIHRCVSFRAGNAAALRAVLLTALPKAMAATANRLADFIFALLGPGYGRAVTAAAALIELERLQAECAAPRLGAMWETEGNNSCALAVLNAFSFSAPKSEVPWQALARLRQMAGDSAGAAVAEENIPQSPEEQRASFMGKTIAAARRGPEGRADMERAVARLKDNGAALDPEEFLFLVYINARFLGHVDESVVLLARDFTVQWHRVIRGVLAARLAAERGAWIDTSGACREARNIIAKMPNTGGAHGRYALAYLHLLDGIAHTRVVETGRNPDYLQDAFSRFEKASQEDGLGQATADWLGVLMQSAGRYPGQDGVQARAEALRNHLAGVSRPGTPQLPWFKESRLFAMLDEGTE